MRVSRSRALRPHITCARILNTHIHPDTSATGRNLMYTPARPYRVGIYHGNFEGIDPRVILWSSTSSSGNDAPASPFCHVRIIFTVTHLVTRDVDKWILRGTEGNQGNRERKTSLRGAPRTRRVPYVSVTSFYFLFFSFSVFSSALVERPSYSGSD